MGAPDRGDWQGSDQAGCLGGGHRLYPAYAEMAVGSWSRGQPATSPRSSEVRVFPRPHAASPFAAAVASDVSGVYHPTFYARIGPSAFRDGRVLPLVLLLFLWLLLPPPAAAQRAAIGGGPDPSIYPTYGHPPMNSGAYGADPSTRGNEPSFDYVVTSPQGPWDSGRSLAPPPGYPGNDSQDVPDYWGFSGPGTSLPASSGGAGPYPGAHGGTGTRQGNDGFRFRGDKAASDAPWHESPSTPGYRFRPVTPEELERSTGGDGWRPIRPDDRRAAEHGESTAPDADAFGYQPDSWFRRYYGERP